MSQNMMETLQKMMNALDQLTKNSESLSQKKIDEYLLVLQGIVKQQLPLKSPFINRFFQALLQTLITHKKRNNLDENQIEQILDIYISMMIQEQSYDFSFINSEAMYINLAAVLIQFCLEQIKTSSSKSIVKKCLVLVAETWQKFEKKKEVYPQICSTLFKILNNEFNNQVKMSKSKYIALNVLDMTMFDLFRDKRVQSKENKKSEKNLEIKNFVVDFMKNTNSSKIKIDQNKQEVSFDHVAINKIKDFIKVINQNIEKAMQFGSKKLFKQFARFCIRCIEINAFDLETLTNIIQIFFYVDQDYDKLEQAKDPQIKQSKYLDKSIPLRYRALQEKKDLYENEQLNPKMIEQLTKKYSKSEISLLMENLKQTMLIEIKRLPHLVTELMEEKYQKTLRKLYRIFEISKETNTDCFLHNEKQLICDSIEKSLKFKFNLKIKLMENSQSVIPLKEIDLKNPIDEKELRDMNNIYKKIKTYLIVQSLPIANYKEDILKEVNRILYSLNKEVSIFIFEHFYSNLVQIDYEKYLLEGSVSSNLLATLCQYHYILQQLTICNFQANLANSSKKQDTFQLSTQAFIGGCFHEQIALQEKNFSVGSKIHFQQYFDHLMVLDFYENFEIKSEDIETLQILAIENAYYCYKLIENNYQNTLRLLTFLLKKHSIDNYSIRQLTELLISTLCYEQQKNQQSQEIITQKQNQGIKDFIQIYSSSIVQRSLVQIRQIDMLQDKEGPFRIMDQLFVKFQGFHYLSNEVENVISTLNKCYDRFYIRSDHSFIRLYLEFFASFIKFWNENTELKQLTLEEIKKKKEEYKKYSDDSNSNSEQYKQDKEESNMNDFLLGSNEDEENKKLRMGNIVRHLLIRIKGLVTSKQKISSVMTLQILQSSLKILYKQKQERENDNVNFSTNDPENIHIPDSLGPILHEFEGSFFYILKDCALESSQYLASGLQVINIYVRILDFTEAQYAFLMVNNVRKNLAPLLLNILKIYTVDFKNSIRGKLSKAIVQFFVGYISRRSDEKFLRSEDSAEDDKIIDDLKNFKQGLIKFLKESKGNESVSKIYVDINQEIYNMLDEIV
ncbi:hypothetical protein TTHERM_00442060 (macronuclear) [Tetrahymena thermophila SB210]|uniref:Uncharacterized protein n=1 Tax=Tetrahymena thermophila (strain SB210) TaxID=312017 RepID=I7MGU0_TETTS|nr:hypothetical protein TTHERM_00442060 [Tetrahymena thermophila SB210]EAR85456.2 hypothetical protein TTHERM_00442060 [Tetrahymena thermophila SB210]|eukprot:XP_001033119.2 hypothetical protein TTHERM_00442060 [Tetrahymena thermophila SB210]